MINTILLKPILTEKSLKEQEVYVFYVARSASKSLIKKAVEELYNVTVGSVRTIVHKGKVKHVGRKRTAKQLADSKKAYITLIKGEIPNIKVQ